MDDARHEFEPDPDVLEASAPEGKTATPLKAVRKHCLWCCNGSAKEVSPQERD
jgi:hypothetical protein